MRNSEYISLSLHAIPNLPVQENPVSCHNQPSVLLAPKVLSTLQVLELIKESNIERQRLIRGFSDILNEVDGSPSPRLPIIDVNLFLNPNPEAAQRLSIGNHSFQDNEAVSGMYERCQ